MQQLVRTSLPKHKKHTIIRMTLAKSKPENKSPDL